MRRLALSFMLATLVAGPAAAEQDLLLGADMTSPSMTKAEMSRADIEAMIKAADGKPVDLHDKALSGLDLSGLNLQTRQVLKGFPAFVLFSMDMEDTDESLLASPTYRSAFIPIPNPKLFVWYLLPGVGANSAYLSDNPFRPREEWSRKTLHCLIEEKIFNTAVILC